MTRSEQLTEVRKNIASDDWRPHFVGGPDLGGPGCAMELTARALNSIGCYHEMTESDGLPSIVADIINQCAMDHGVSVIELNDGGRRDLILETINGMIDRAKMDEPDESIKIPIEENTRSEIDQPNESIYTYV